ncbi:MAG: Ig-like domain-containing protein [Mycobacteriales bacterium]
MSVRQRGRGRAGTVLVGAIALLAAGTACTASSQDGGAGQAHPPAQTQSSAQTRSSAQTQSSAPVPSSSGGVDPSTSPSGGPKPVESTSAHPGVAPQPTPVSVGVRPASGGTGFDPTKPVVVRATHGRLATVTVTNPAGTLVTGKMSSDRSTWTSDEDLGYAKTYRVTATATGAAGARPVRKTASFTTVEPRTLTYPDIFPPPSITDVGVGQPIDVTFDETITDRAAAERALRVTSVPAQTGAWHWMSDKDVQWRPQHYWRAGSKVTLRAMVYGKNLGDGVYGQEDRTSSFTVHDRLEVIGSVPDHNLQVYDNGTLVRTIPASFGKPATPTHSGVHVIYQKFHMYLMNSCSYGVCSGPSAYTNFKAYYAQRISSDGEFVHVNEATVSDQGSRNVSHGCINVSMSEGIWLYDHVGVGDIVDVRGGDPQLPIDDGYGAWNASWSQWLAGSALHS